MSDRTRLTRRTLLSAAVGGAALAATSLATAATPHQTEGPFFPKKNPPEKDFDMTRLPAARTLVTLRPKDAGGAS